MMKFLKKHSSLLCLLVVVFAILIYTGTVTKNYTIKVINTALLNSLVAYGLSLMLGVGGQLVFSGITFMGIGAYTTANLLTGRLGITCSSTAAMMYSLLVAGIIAIVFGMLFMRLRGVFCTFATIGLVTICYSLFAFYQPLFGRPDGISGIPSWTLFGHTLKGYREWFYVLLIIVLLVGLVMERIRGSRFGRALSAVRDNEIAAQTLGVNLYWTRVFAFVIASLFAALGGSLFAMHNKFVFANSFSYNQSINVLVMAMLGGINSTPGILIGAVLVTFLPELLRNVSSGLIMLTYGVLVIFLMIFMPMGIGGLLENGFKKLYRWQKKKDAIKLANKTEGE